MPLPNISGAQHGRRRICQFDNIVFQQIGQTEVVMGWEADVLTGHIFVSRADSPPVPPSTLERSNGSPA